MKPIHQHIKSRMHLSVFCTFVCSLIWAQNQITFRQLSVKQGLSQNSAISITQDSIGYLWIATQDGLNKYDGRLFSVYPYTFVDITKPDYSNLGKVYTDRQGGLWIIPINGIPQKLNVTSGNFDSLSGIRDASVIYQDRDLNIWIGTHNKGLHILRPDKMAPDQIIAPSEINGTIYNIAQNAEGTLFLAIDKGIIALEYSSNNIRHIHPETIYGAPIAQNFSDLVVDDSGRKWVGTFGDGLYFWEGSEAVFHRISELSFTDPLPQDLNILDLFMDSKERLWVATYGRGLYMINFRANKITRFNAEKHNPKAIHYNDILCIYEDYSGTLWFGTDGAGLSYYDEYLEKFNSFTNYQTPNDINIDVVRSLAVDRNNTLWIGTSGKGLTQYDPGSNSWRTFKEAVGIENSISSNRVMSLLADKENDLWIGTQGEGLNIRMANGEFRHYNPSSKIPLSAKTIWDLFMDSKGRIWLGTREEGLLQFDKAKGEMVKFKHEPLDENSLPSNNIRVITEDKEGNLWIGTEADGVVFFDPEKRSFTTLREQAHENSLSNNGIKSLYFALNGILWIGTNGGGLNAFDVANNKFYHYTVEDGLANNVIYAILPDAAGNLWLSSNKGITKFSPGEMLSSEAEIINYTNYDGLATEFNTGAYYKDPQGRLYYGGLDGFYWFMPNQIIANTTLPKTVITGLQVFNEAYPMEPRMQLSNDENTLSFSFSSLQFSLPEKNQYQYRMMNYDEDWVWAGNTNFARYTQLPPGDYEFQVKSSNYDGVWNEQPTSFSFTITPPWYWTIWAKIIYVLLFLGGVYGLITYFRWRWKMKLDLQFKEDEAVRLKSLNDFKSKLYTDISHEFRTPLTLISGPIESKLSEGGLSNSDLTNFSMIRRNTSRLLSLVDQLLDLAKVDEGKLKFKLIQGNLGLFLRNICASFEYQAESKKITYSSEVGPMEGLWYDEDVIEKITMNLLSNAIKYCPEHGHCYFKAQNSDDKLSIVVANAVNNLTDIPLENLFSRFFQQDEFSSGAGVGLSLVKELVNLYGGEIDVEQGVGNEIVFKVSLPVNKDFFTSQDIPVLENQNIESDVPASENTELLTNENNTPLKNAELPIILIVEDNSDVRQFIAMELGKKNQIHTAENGLLGIEKAIKLVPDIIISDVRMPLCDGIELCNTLKNDERTSHIPIILLTAHIGEDNELQGLKSGADDFITKPFKLRILEKRVENLIATRRALRSRYSQEVVLQAKDIAVTPTDELFLNRMQKVLDQYISEADFNAAAFCRELGMSRMQLHRKLLAYTGLSTTAFLRSQRLKQALHILRTSDATVNEVAYAVGFNTPSYFIKCFKEAYKKTPSEYLQSTGI